MELFIWVNIFLSVLFQLAAGPGPKNFNSPYRYLWIGLTDVDVEGRYVWNSTGDVTTYTFWYSGQPNNYNNQDYCVLNWDEIGRWHDVSVSTFSVAVASMCEQTLTPTLPSNHQNSINLYVGSGYDTIQNTIHS
jgi:hypothetical protein